MRPALRDCGLRIAQQAPSLPVLAVLTAATVVLLAPAGARAARLAPDYNHSRTRAQHVSEEDYDMTLSETEQQLREQFLQVMLQAACPLQQGPDREKTLQALIAAAAMLRDRFEQDLAELRQEEAD